LRLGVFEDFEVVLGEAADGRVVFVDDVERDRDEAGFDVDGWGLGVLAVDRACFWSFDGRGRLLRRVRTGGE
jgi:hypothetical protein